jgi:hypothetical protein
MHESTMLSKYVFPITSSFLICIARMHKSLCNPASYQLISIIKNSILREEIEATKASLELLR